MNDFKLSSNSFEAFALGWDTDFFGVKSAKVILKDGVSQDEQNIILDYCNKFDFVTIYNLSNNNQNNVWIGERTKAFLTDMNIQFIKQINEDPEALDETTNIAVLLPKDENILSIAKRAFSYSRFFNDPWLPKERARDIYLHWTECAFDKPEKYFAIKKKNDKVAGYLLFSMNLESCLVVIELIAVDEVFRGQNIGKSLIHRLESFAYQEGVRFVKVGTQVDNVASAKFYNTCGFRYESCNSVYHYWPSK